ncbi:hypothetical protein ACFCX4_10695 [Kitasatospora sp. NPDC056327]|uniref:hypothetical protein n=1 Tax=Kitasatospora sp. NPDC056327 TaxID=3345785 RepID=UPI0035DD599A
MTLDQRYAISSALLLAVTARRDRTGGSWQELVGLVRSPTASGAPPERDGLRALERFLDALDSPSARTLAEVLWERAHGDHAFREALLGWVGTVHGEPAAVQVNMISGGTFHGNVVQTGDFNSVHIFTSEPGKRG